MIYYPDGTEAKIGDTVSYDGLVALVEDVIDSKEDMANWNVEKRGLMLKESTKYGRVFQAIEAGEWETNIVFKARTRLGD